MSIYDRNLTHGLVLEGTAYRPLVDADTFSELTIVDYVYLKQMHYVARSKAQGMFIATDPMLKGWVRMESLAWMESIK